MPDIIELLPDNVANQIAAGEVIQRPASAAKELLENALDAGSNSIKLVVKDAGRTLIQVIDNGQGMSETDARMSFERHATSKIKKADDLFSLSTMGFRGEALASIAAIASVELKTKKVASEVGTLLLLEGSEIKKQEVCSCAEGTSISIKNLFYNVPARRNFLKSDNVEFRHIVEEFQRVAIPNPEISFVLIHNGSEVFNLPSGSLKQRLIALFGKTYNTRLIPVEEETDIVDIKGFVIKPEFAKKTRGDQYFFLNDRFIKSPYLHHAVTAAFENLLPKENHAGYFLMLYVQPNSIDVNIHPTKTEVKFEDEKAIYAFLRSTIKKSLGQFNISPSIDFDQEAHLYNMPIKPSDGVIRQPTIKVDKNYNPFENKSGSNVGVGNDRINSNKKNWDKMYDFEPESEISSMNYVDKENQEEFVFDDINTDFIRKDQVFQLHTKYLIAQYKLGLLVIDQRRAHKRVLFERIVKNQKSKKRLSQKELFPKSLAMSTADYLLVQEIKGELEGIGFELQDETKNTYLITGVPADAAGVDAIELLEGIVDDYKQSLQKLDTNKDNSIAMSIANRLAIKVGVKLSSEEIIQLINDLLACETPGMNIDGGKTYVVFPINQIENCFRDGI